MRHVLHIRHHRLLSGQQLPLPCSQDPLADRGILEVQTTRAVNPELEKPGIAASAIQAPRPG